MLHWSMRNDSRDADELYIQRGCLALEGFSDCSLDSFSFLERQQMTLKQHQLLSGLDSST